MLCVYVLVDGYLQSDEKKGCLQSIQLIKIDVCVYILSDGYLFSKYTLH